MSEPLREISILSHVLSLSWVRDAIVDENPKTTVTDDGATVRYRVRMNGREFVRDASCQHPCRAFSHARYLAASDALATATHEQTAELARLGFAPRFRRPLSLRETA